MKRYIVLLAGLALILSGCVLLLVFFTKLGDEPRRIRQSPILSQLMSMPMPSDAIDIQDMHDDLFALGQYGQSALLRDYQVYQVLSRALGRVPETPTTFGEAATWARRSADLVQQAKMEALTHALTVDLAPSDVTPLGARGSFTGKDFVSEGNGVWTGFSPQQGETPQHRPPHYFVVEVRNQLQTPLKEFDFNLSVIDAGGKPADLKESKISCFGTDLPPGARQRLRCDQFVPLNATFSAADFSRVLQHIRRGTMQFKVLANNLYLDLSGEHRTVGLQIPKSAFVVKPRDRNEPEHGMVAQSTCRQRGDCAEKFRERLGNFVGMPVTWVLIVLIGMLPGAITAGLMRAIARTRASRIGTVIVLALSSLAAFPFAFISISGWGALAAMAYLPFPVLGFWLGLLLGWKALSAPKENVSGGK